MRKEDRCFTGKSFTSVLFSLLKIYGKPQDVFKNNYSIKFIFNDAPTSRLLYYDLGLSADDDGFCEHYTIMKMTDAKPDDLKVLQAKGFVKVFDDKVLIILDWKENNYIQNDRYTPSKYLKIYKKNYYYWLIIINVYKVYPLWIHRLG